MIDEEDEDQMDGSFEDGAPQQQNNNPGNSSDSCNSMPPQPLPSSLYQAEHHQQRSFPSRHRGICCRTVKKEFVVMVEETESSRASPAQERDRERRAFEMIQMV